MAMHTAESDVCASCHKIFEPMGLALENFDAVGAWRTRTRRSPSIRPACWSDGTQGRRRREPARRRWSRHSDQFVRVVAEKLLTYALGRGVEYQDMPLVRSIVRDAAASNYTFSSLVLGIVKSAAVPDEHRRPPSRHGRSDAARPLADESKEDRPCSSPRNTSPATDASCAARASRWRCRCSTRWCRRRRRWRRRRPAPKPRFVGCFVPHGMAPGYWVPENGRRAGREFPFNFKPLEPFREQTVIMSGLHSRSAEPPPGVTGADHWVAAAFLCAEQAQEDGRRRRLRRHHHRPDDRAEDRRGKR